MTRSSTHWRYRPTCATFLRVLCIRKIKADKNLLSSETAKTHEAWICRQHARDSRTGILTTPAFSHILLMHFLCLAVGNETIEACEYGADATPVGCAGPVILRVKVCTDAFLDVGSKRTTRNKRRPSRQRKKNVNMIAHATTRAWHVELMLSEY